MNKYIVTSCEYRLTEDNWKEGEGKTLSVWSEDIEGGDSIPLILSHVHYLDRDFDINRKLEDIFENDPVNDGDYSRFDGDLIVDIDKENDWIVKPSAVKYNEWKDGKCLLYNLHICLYIRKIKDLNDTDVKEFNNLKKKGLH